jgi:hypothetical protein
LMPPDNAKPQMNWVLDSSSAVATCGNGEHRKIQGMVDMMDICAFGLTAIEQIEKDKTKTLSGLFAGQWTKDLVSAPTRLSSSHWVLLMLFVDFSKCNYTYPLDRAASFEEVLETLCTKKVHRVPIVHKGADLPNKIQSRTVLNTYNNTIIRGDGGTHNSVRCSQVHISQS